MRAREPDSRGTSTRDGVRIAYESFGRRPARRSLFPPIDTIVHSRAWKAQVPYLAQHFRVVTIDPRGNGRSDRPTDPAAYGDLEFVDDTIAVMDQLGIERAVLVGICDSAWQALLCAALHPDRVQGVVAIAPWARDDTPPFACGWRRSALRRGAADLRRLVPVQPALLAEDWPDFAAVLLRPDLPEPHSTKLLEDVVGWARETTGEVILARARRRARSRTPPRRPRAAARRSPPGARRSRAPRTAVSPQGRATPWRG